MDFLQLEYFTEVAKTKKITKSADKLHISQPALSQMIKKLEAEMGSDLFYRTPNGFVLTEEGGIFLDYAQKALQERCEIYQKLKDMKKNISGTITVQANAISYLIAELFCEFKKLYSNTDICFISENTFRNNLYNVDPFSEISLFITTKPPSAFAHQYLLKEEIFLAALPLTHPKANKQHICLSELKNEKFLVFQGGELQMMTEAYCKDCGFTPNILLECHNTNILFNLVASGFGISLFPESWKSFCGGKICLIPLDGSYTRKIYICWSNTRYISKAAQYFRDFLISKLS